MQSLTDPESDGTLGGRDAETAVPADVHRHVGAMLQ